MKKTVNKYWIKRTSTSPYFSADFNQQENLKLSPWASMIQGESKILPDFLITNTHTKKEYFTPDLLKNLKLIIHPNSGHDNFYDRFNEDLVIQKDVPIIIGNPIRSHAVSEYILSAIFKHYSSFASHLEWDKTRKWNRSLLNESKVAIIGHGHIGKILNESLRPLVKQITIYDPYEGFNNLDLINANILIMACSYNKHNHHMIDKMKLNSLAEDVLIINTSRGELINTQELVTFLASHPKSYAVLDVFENEPNDFKLFSHLKNITHTSHIAGVYKNIDQKTIEFEVAVLKDYFELEKDLFHKKYDKMILQNKYRKDIGVI